MATSWLHRRRALSLLPMLAASLLATWPAGAEEIRENEALVMRLVFEDCLGYLRHDRTPFQGLPTRPATASVAGQFPAAMPDRNQIVQLLSPRYAAAWGRDGNGRHCMIKMVADPWPPPEPGLLGIHPSGFIGRVTARAALEGITRHPGPKEAFSPLDITTWSEPETGHDTGPRRPVAIVIMPTGRNGDGSVVDAGLIVLAGPP